MPKPRKGPRLGAGPAHQKLMLGGLAASLFTHERLRTTESKAKALRPVAERLITFAKRGDVHARRQVLKVIPDRDVVHRLFADIAPRYEERPGGYTRILKLGPRQGDGALMAQIELVEEEFEPGADEEGEEPDEAAPEQEEGDRKGRGGLRRRGGKRRADVGEPQAEAGEPDEEPDEDSATPEDSEPAEDAEPAEDEGEKQADKE